jgi:voltage-gated potassium channel
MQMNVLNFNKKILDTIRNTIFWMMVLLVVSFGASLIMYQFEIEAGSEAFQSLEDLSWWWLQTVTGIGSTVYLYTTEGRLMAAIVIFTGLVLLGLLISEISAIIRMIYARKDEGNIKVRDRGHIVIFGYTSLTAGVVKLIRRHFGDQIKIVLISNDVKTNPFPGQVDFIHDNPINKTTLDDSNVSQATAAIILSNDRFLDPDTYSLVIASGIEKQNSQVITIVQVNDEEKKILFKKARVDAFLDKFELLNDLLDHNPNPKLKRVILKESGLEENLNREVSPDLL